LMPHDQETDSTSFPNLLTSSGMGLGDSFHNWFPLLL